MHLIILLLLKWFLKWNWNIQPPASVFSFPLILLWAVERKMGVHYCTVACMCVCMCVGVCSCACLECGCCLRDVWDNVHVNYTVRSVMFRCSGTSSLFISWQSNYANLKVSFKFYSTCVTGVFNDLEHDGKECVCVCVCYVIKQNLLPVSTEPWKQNTASIQ